MKKMLTIFLTMLLAMCIGTINISAEADESTKTYGADYSNTNYIVEWNDTKGDIHKGTISEYYVYKNNVSSENYIAFWTDCEGTEYDKTSTYVQDIHDVMLKNEDKYRELGLITNEAVCESVELTIDMLTKGSDGYYYYHNDKYNADVKVKGFSKEADAGLYILKDPYNVSNNRHYEKHEHTIGCIYRIVTTKFNIIYNNPIDVPSNEELGIANLVYDGNVHYVNDDQGFNISGDTYGVEAGEYTTYLSKDGFAFKLPDETLTTSVKITWSISKGKYNKPIINTIGIVNEETNKSEFLLLLDKNNPEYGKDFGIIIGKKDYEIDFDRFYKDDNGNKYGIIEIDYKGKKNNTYNIFAYGDNNHDNSDNVTIKLLKEDSLGLNISASDLSFTQGHDQDLSIEYVFTNINDYSIEENEFELSKKYNLPKYVTVDGDELNEKDYKIKYEYDNKKGIPSKIVVTLKGEYLQNMEVGDYNVNLHAGIEIRGAIASVNLASTVSVNAQSSNKEKIKIVATGIE